MSTQEIPCTSIIGPLLGHGKFWIDDDWNSTKKFSASRERSSTPNGIYICFEYFYRSLESCSRSVEECVMHCTCFLHCTPWSPAEVPDPDSTNRSIQVFLIYPRSIRIWNDLPPSVVLIPDTAAFKEAALPIIRGMLPPPGSNLLLVIPCHVHIVHPKFLHFVDVVDCGQDMFSSPSVRYLQFFILHQMAVTPSLHQF